MTAKVIPIRKHLPRGVAPDRRGINGHHPDCPYSHVAPPEHCSVCQGIRKGETA